MAEIKRSDAIQSHLIGSDGKVRVYDMEAGEWVRRAPIDAREMIGGGTATLDGPADDAAPQPPPAPAPEPEPETEPTPDTPQPEPDADGDPADGDGEPDVG